MDYKGSTVYCFRRVRNPKSNKYMYIHMHRPVSSTWLGVNDWEFAKFVLYSSIKAFHIIYPGVIENKFKVGQFVNPTKLLRQHLALPKGEITHEN